MSKAIVCFLAILPITRTKLHRMLRLSIVSGIVLLGVIGLAFSQQNPSASQDAQPFLKKCSDTNPAPCADKAPVVIHAPGPACSKEADKATVNGTVVLTVVVGTDGFAHDISVVKPLGYGLDERAIGAIKQWRLKPAEALGKPAPVQTQVALEFHCPPAKGKEDAKDGRSLGNWYSLDTDKEMGERYSAELERDSKLIDDSAIADYVARIADNVARNSDAQFPITVRLLDSDQVEAITLPGGYQYVSRGLLLQLENEGELASVLARGIAHTATRSITRLMTRAGWAEIEVPPITAGSGGQPNVVSGNFRGQIELTVPSVGSGAQPNIFSEVADSMTMLSIRRRFELEADYVGMQYVYKAGYNPESFVHFVELIWPASGTKTKASNPFPPTPDRLKALREEIAKRFPTQDGKTVSTPEFESFKERLRAWKPKEPVPTPTGEKPLPRE